jgi:hypothetical protein
MSGKLPKRRPISHWHIKRTLDTREPQPFMATFDLIATTVSISIVLYLYIKRRGNRSTRNLPLPPGPKKLLFVGNLFDMPNGLSWEAYHGWSKEFGMSPATQSLAETTQVVHWDRFRNHTSGRCWNLHHSLGHSGCGDRPAGEEIFHIFRKVCGIYPPHCCVTFSQTILFSIRPSQPMISDLMGWDFATAILPYGNAYTCFHFQNSIQFIT